MKIKRLPDTNDIVLLIKENNGYCPCKVLKNEDTKCICKEFLEQKKGIFECGLYEKIEE